MKNEAFVKLRDVCKIYGTENSQVYALRDVSAEAYRGEYLSIMGPSGSGKSTFFNMLGGLDRCSSGTVEIGSVDLSTLNDAELAYFRGQYIGYIFQAYNLIASMTALKNVALPALFAGTPPDKAQEKANEVLTRVGLGDRVHHKPHELSGGQQQRVAIARALVNTPPIILADEPTANLDLHTGEEIICLLKELSDELGVTIITATHDHKMLKTSDRILWIVDGMVDRVEDVQDLEIETGSIESND